MKCLICKVLSIIGVSIAWCDAPVVVPPPVVVPVVPPVDPSASK